VKVTRMLFPEEQISGGGFLSPQNRPINSLEVAELSLISMNEPKQDGNVNTSSVSLTLKPLSADITHVHCLPEPQTAGLSELVINLDVLLACSLTGLLFCNFRRETPARNPRRLFLESDLNFIQICVPSE